MYIVDIDAFNERDGIRRTIEDYKLESLEQLSIIVDFAFLSEDQLQFTIRKI